MSTAATRPFNFSPGPAVLPEEVLQQAREDLWDVEGSGIGVLEQSHRGDFADRMIAEVISDCRKLARIPEEYRVLFLHGGASTQFFMLPANFLAADRGADYLDTGSWSTKAIQEARRYGMVHVAASSKDCGFDHIPGTDEIRWSDDPVYAHFTSNNTIFGTGFSEPPVPPKGCWLACDASSDIFSKPIDVSRFGLLYASAQKNLGPAGVTLVIIREDLLKATVRDLPTMLRYRAHADNDSRYNTPNVFGIYVVGRVLKWLLALGGLEAIEARNLAKAGLLYDAIDRSSVFEGTARPDSRSRMNITFRARSKEIDVEFLAQAQARELLGLKGHRSVGGMRASIYNAFPEEGCQALARLIREFDSRYG